MLDLTSIHQKTVPINDIAPTTLVIFPIKFSFMKKS